EISDTSAVGTETQARPHAKSGQPRAHGIVPDVALHQAGFRRSEIKEHMRTSNLQSPGERFLSLCLSYSLDENWLSAADLNEEFPAAKLMTALEAAPELRAKVLVKAAGVHEKIAPKK